MSVKHQQGFTIIEVSLFLAISALLVAVLLGGWTTMINTQRYKDSNKTLQTFLQDQYNLVYNVQNDRDTSFTCEDGVVKKIDGDGQPRGQTECILMGRYIDIRKGQDITVRNIAGQKPSSSDTISDFETIRDYSPTRIDDSLGLSNTELRIPWEAVAVGVNDSDTPVNRAIVIIRSPSSGSVYTFTAAYGSDASLPVLDGELINENAQQDIPLCLDSGAVLSGGRMGVVIRRNASSQSFVQSINDDVEGDDISC